MTPFHRVLVTGSCGLVGSTAARFYTGLGANVVGMDDDSRGRWFGPTGSVLPTLDSMLGLDGYEHHGASVTDREAVEEIVGQTRPDLIIHCAAQPSHDKSAEIPWDDFAVNATGTMNLLDAARRHCPASPFVFASTNKVYGDRPNAEPLVETDTRYEFADADLALFGVPETMSLDASLHSVFGASKAAADLMVQEFGRYYGMPTACFRCGCITGAGHRGVELHGFLAYLCRCAREGLPYTVFGHGGKQVRDNIHAEDLVRAFDEFARDPRPGAIYNIGGGRVNSCSVVEAVRMVEERLGVEVATKGGPARKGDHVCYHTDLRKFRADYPAWEIRRSLGDILDELLG